jgi:two-component system chemotaxis response regulator CheB
VDDSAVVRQAFTLVLSRHRDITVETASDPILAMDRIRRRRPSVLVLDLELPRMDGLTFLRQLMRDDPLPVVVCSGRVRAGSEAAVRALEEGAVELIAKPDLGVGDFLRESSTLLVDTVRAAARARPRAQKLAPAPSPRGPTTLTPPPLLRVTTDKVIAVGASTGGTDALRQLLEVMPPDCPGFVIVQHMPQYFMTAMARRLQQLCRIEVKEAAHGDRITQGRALIAPGNRHMRVVRSGGHYQVELSDEPPVAWHRPSVDVLFHSVARAAGPNAVGALLTGMGSDGAQGLLAMKRAGAATLAQDEASCVVFGMPKEAIALGAVDEVVPLERMAEAVLRWARRAVSQP